MGVIVTDPELMAMGKIARIMAKLDPAAQERVLGFLMDRYTQARAATLLPPATAPATGPFTKDLETERFSGALPLTGHKR